MSSNGHGTLYANIYLSLPTPIYTKMVRGRSYVEVWELVSLFPTVTKRMHGRSCHIIL